MKLVCEKNKCTGCMACVDACPVQAIKIVDSLDAFNAEIQENCLKCGKCHKICQNNYPITKKEPIKWIQGWANNEELRENSSSGGFATEISNSFIRKGGCVFGCVIEQGEISFKMAETIEEVKQFTGSKYVKSNPKNIYKVIKYKLKQGTKVLFIGLPCQVAGLYSFLDEKLQSNLYTIDLICHGSPSPKILKMYLKQHYSDLNSNSHIKFREKEKFCISGVSKVEKPGIIDRYTISFLRGLTYTENCYSCQYAEKNRISDLTIGDSWGSELNFVEKSKGISLGICTSEKGNWLLDNADLHLEPVNIEKAINSNHQLMHPSIKPKGRDDFINSLQANKNFDFEFAKIRPKIAFRQNIKKLLIKLNLIGIKN